MHQNVRWHVVFTKQHCERKVVDALSRKGYQCFCPHHTVSAQWKNLDGPIRKALFASFVFVRCTEDQFPDIKKTPGIINFLYRLNRPAVVPKEDIAAIQHAVSNYKEIQLLKIGLHSPVHAMQQESDAYSYPLFSLGFMLVASKEKVMASEPVLAGDTPKPTRFSYRFRLVWR